MHSTATIVNPAPVALRAFPRPRACRIPAATALSAIALSSNAADAAPPSLAWLGPHAAWLFLAALGLVAVVLAAFTVRRPPKGMRALGELTTELRDVSGVDTTTRGERVEPVLVRGPADGPPASAPVAAAVADTTPPRAESRSAPGAQPVDATPVHVERPGAEPSRVDAPPPSSPRHDGSQLFLALHHVDLSIDVLRRHIAAERRPMPAVWLMLLDLARTHGREQTFRDLAGEFHRRFNVRAPAWEGYPPDADEPGLEAYPRLVKEITLTWGTHECRRLLDRLLYDNRNGDRRGFTLNAYNDLIALRRAADAVIDTIEQDLAEEAKLRSAFATASAEADDADVTMRGEHSPLVRDLESQLDSDLRAATQPASAIEREHPALVGMLAREWGNAALSARLCEMLARGGDGAHGLSKEAAEELELLRAMAERLAAVNGIELPVDEPEASPAATAR